MQDVVFGVAETAHIHVFHGDVSIDDAGDNDGGRGNAVGDFADDLGYRVQCRGLHTGPSVIVDNHGCDGVHGNIRNLEECERFGEIFGHFQFGGKREEGGVTGVGEDYVGDREESGMKRCVGLSPEGDVARLRSLDGRADHSCEDSTKNADKGGDAEERHVLQCPGKGQNERDDCASEHKDHCAGAVVRELS